MKVENVVAFADSIAWDGCHKIYILMDTDETARMREYGYQVWGVTDTAGSVATIKYWWDRACVLRFVSAIRSSGEFDSKFTTVIGQGEEWK